MAADAVGDDLSQRPALRARVAAYWHTYRAHLAEIRALREAALSSRTFEQQLAAIRHAQLDTMRTHLVRLSDAGCQLAGDPAVVASAFNALLEGLLCGVDWRGGRTHREGAG